MIIIFINLLAEQGVDVILSVLDRHSGLLAVPVHHLAVMVPVLPLRPHAEAVSNFRTVQMARPLDGVKRPEGRVRRMVYLLPSHRFVILEAVDI